MGDGAGGDHLAGEGAGFAAPEREMRPHSGPGALGLAVGADIGEVEIAEDDIGDPLREERREGGRHPGLVDLVRAGRGERNLDERQADGSGLGAQHLAPDAVDRDPVVGFADGGQQPDDIERARLARHMEGEGAVLARAPGEDRPRLHLAAVGTRGV